MPPFCVGYLKGRTRAMVILSLLSLARDGKMDNFHEANGLSHNNNVSDIIQGYTEYMNLWNQVHPKLLESVRGISCHFIRATSQRQALLTNFKLSIRGSIRKTTNVMKLSCSRSVCLFVCQNLDWCKMSCQLRTWVTSITNLREHEPRLDASELATRHSKVTGRCQWTTSLQLMTTLIDNLDAQVREHNSKNAKDGQLTGQKAQAVKNILELFDKRAAQLLVDYTLEVGHEKGPWTDNCLGSAKLVPGFVQGPKLFQVLATGLLRCCSFKKYSNGFRFRSGAAGGGGNNWANRGKVTKESNWLMVPLIYLAPREFNSSLLSLFTWALILDPLRDC